MDIIEALKIDYQNFPKNQTFSLYAEDVFFKDPMNEFQGCDRYQKMIGFIERWFKSPQLDLHRIKAYDKCSAQADPCLEAPAISHIQTDWTLQWTTPLPWQPRIRISGWSELGLNAEELIISHVDYWHCSILDVLKQHLPFSNHS